MVFRCFMGLVDIIEETRSGARFSISERMRLVLKEKTGTYL